MPRRALDISHHQEPVVGGVRVVTADIGLAVEAGALGFNTRSNYGERVDTTAREHNRRIDAAGAPRAFYWYDLSRQDPRRMAEIAFEQSGSRRGRRGYCDIEENRRADGADPVFPPRSSGYFNHINAGLLRCDDLTGELTGLYSNSFLDAWFSREQLAVWAELGRPLWTAHWAEPGPGIPYVATAWRNRPKPYVLWQDRVGPWPGFAIPGTVVNVDQNIVPAWIVSLSEIFGSAAAGAPPVVVPPPAASVAADIAGHATAIKELL
jgi:hypothetical protein